MDNNIDLGPLTQYLSEEERLIFIQLIKLNFIRKENATLKLELDRERNTANQPKARISEG